MPEHFTRNTVMASFWCSKCSKATMHRVDGVKRGYCMPCMEKLEAMPKKTDLPAIKQGALFEDALSRDRRGD